MALMATGTWSIKEMTVAKALTRKLFVVHVMSPDPRTCNHKDTKYVLKLGQDTTGT